MKQNLFEKHVREKNKSFTGFQLQLNIQVISMTYCYFHRLLYPSEPKIKDTILAYLGRINYLEAPFRVLQYNTPWG